MINSELHFTLEEILPKFAPQMRKKILHSVELLRKAEKLALAYDNENGYYLAFSGGKDSQCLYHIASVAGVKFKAHMNLTSVDPPEVIRFVKQQYPDVDMIKPRDSIYNIAIKKQMLPTMRVRWCCAEFKESAGAGKVTFIGIRHAESTRRAKRNEVEINNRKFSGTFEQLDEYREKQSNIKKRGRKPQAKEINITNADDERVLGCIHGKEILLISPIIYWTDEDVWTFLNTLGIAHCELYDQGFHRIGCINCPMSSHKQKMIEIARYPHVKRNWLKAIKAIRSRGKLQKRSYAHGNPEKPRGYEFRENNKGFYINNKSMSDDQAFLNKQSTEDCEHGFLDSFLSDRFTREQDNEIDENIYDWWISGKGYKQWYAEKFQQTMLNFKNE